MLATILTFLAELFGKWLNRTPPAEPIAEQLGKAEQANADQGAAYDTLAKAADARADADVERVLGQPDSGKADPDAARQRFPGVKFRD